MLLSSARGGVTGAGAGCRNLGRECSGTSYTGCGGGGGAEGGPVPYRLLARPMEEQGELSRLPGPRPPLRGWLWNVPYSESCLLHR